jgi:hypothetical protein
VYQRCGVRVAPAHEEPRSGSNNSEHESTSGRSTNYESGRLIRVFRDIGRIFSLLFLLSHPLPVGHRLRKRVQKRKTEYGFVEGKNGFNCISCGTPRVERRILRQNENPAGLCEGARAGSREPSVECRTNYCCYEGSARKTRKRARGSSRNFRHDKLKGIHSSKFRDALPGFSEPRLRQCVGPGLLVHLLTSLLIERRRRSPARRRA